MSIDDVWHRVTRVHPKTALNRAKKLISVSEGLVFCLFGVPLNIRTAIRYLLMALLLQIYFDCAATFFYFIILVVAVHCSHSLQVKLDGRLREK